MYKNYNETVQMLYERLHINPNIVVRATSDVPSTVNQFTTRPQGIIIQDTFNNFALPIRPDPRLDTANFDLPKVIQRYRENYTDFRPLLLPWHYCVELVDDQYYIFNTRPISFKYPLSNNDISKNVDTSFWDERTQKFFDNQLFDIGEAIHICLIGDSNLDVYPQKMYTLLGRVCLSPLFGRLNIIRSSSQNVQALNVGRRFNLELLNRFSR